MFFLLQRFCASGPEVLAVQHNFAAENPMEVNTALP